MNLMKKYCLESIDLLKYLNCLPKNFTYKIEITKAKTYYGRCIKEDKEIIIRLSTWNHVDVKWLMDKEDYLEIIDTISHELAHVIKMEHSNDHLEITKLFKDIIIDYYKLLEVV